MMHDDMKRVGKIIQDARQSRGITQQALADTIGVSLRTVIAIENGKRNPTFDTISGIIKTLSIPADLVFRLDELPHTQEQAKFIQEYLDADAQSQSLSMAVLRTVWRELHERDR